MTETRQEDYGALVGWTSSRAGDRVTLNLQSVSKPPPHKQGDVKSQFYMMDRNQAAQLAHYLFEMGDTTPPAKSDRGWLRRMFG